MTLGSSRKMFQGVSIKNRGSISKIFQKATPQELFSMNMDSMIHLNFRCLPSLKLTANAPENWMVGRLVCFLAGAQGVYTCFTWTLDTKVISFNSTISSCDKGHAWQQAVWLFRSLQQAQVRPDDISFYGFFGGDEKDI